MARLTTKGLQAGMIFGGIPELTRTDIAAACSGLEPLHMHLIMAKYCDDIHSALAALNEIQDLMCDKSRFWADCDAGIRYKIGLAMVQEFVSATRCRSCKGTGSKTVDSKIADCKGCGGSGNADKSAASRARMSGIPETTYRKYGLNDPFTDMMRYLDDIEIRSIERIARKAS